MSNRLRTEHQDIGITCLHCGQINLPPSKDSFDSWNCSYCHSGFVSIVMLTNLGSRELIDQIDAKAHELPAPGRPCPRCRKSMKQVEVGFNERDLRLEVCRKCRLIWFDSGDMMRMLRQRPPEPTAVVEEEEGDEPITTKAPTVAPAVARGFMPQRTIELIILFAALVPLTSHLPGLLATYGFVPGAAFRLMGATWITSLFLHDGVVSLMCSLPVLLILGSFVERKLGTRRYLSLFIASGVMGRFVYTLATPDVDTVVVGSGCAVCGVAAYGLLTFPYRPFLFPDQRWRSPLGALLALGVGVILVLCLILGFDFFWTLISQVAKGMDGSDASASMLATVVDWTRNAAFRAHLAGAAAGALVCLGDATAKKIGPTSKKTRPAPARPYRRATFR